jgi:hypothetical protein
VPWRSLHDGGVAYRRPQTVNHRLVDGDWTRFNSSLLAWYAWLIWFLFLSTSPHLSFGQEAPSSPGKKESSSSQNREREAGRTGADSAGPAGDSTLGEEETIRRDRLSQRFGQQPLTPEEEEAMRLSAIAARIGTDPTAIIGRVQTLFRYDALEGGKQTNNLVARLDAPYHGNFLFRADLPYVWSNPNQPGTSNQGGVSDLFVRAGGVCMPIQRTPCVPGWTLHSRPQINSWGVANTRSDQGWRQPMYFPRGARLSSHCSNTNSRWVGILLDELSPCPIFRPFSTRFGQTDGGPELRQ